VQHMIESRPSDTWVWKSTKYVPHAWNYLPLQRAISP
jgi:hypothetical protein